ncbi:hypothetical protein [Lacticaseibacillus parakribbianus]|uniref:hypothetical protein n=1 Tax=Lacticaseibacillus parakribbianus TaxID=2970927 RepID=UPI0021CB242A|nr:hypothetical protein [Lacticaseibacillus parakribbianus]
MEHTITITTELKENGVATLISSEATSSVEVSAALEALVSYIAKDAGKKLSLVATALLMTLMAKEGAEVD